MAPFSRRYCVGIPFVFTLGFILIATTQTGKLSSNALTELFSTHIFGEHLSTLNREFNWSSILPVTERPGVCSQRERQAHIRSVCEARGWSASPFDMATIRSNIIVDHKHRLIYCVVPKCGSISFRTLLGRLATHQADFSLSQRFLIQSNKTNNSFLDATGFSTLSSYPTADQIALLRGYTKLIVVRHPLSKLRSIYANKLSNPGLLNAKALSRNTPIITKYLRNKGFDMPRDFNPLNETITFHQFLELIATETDNGFWDTHWVTTMDRCRPCHINYDLMLRLETIQEDITMFLDYLKGFETDPNYVYLNNSNPTSNRSDVMKTTESRLYGNVDTDVIDGIMKIYQPDFEIFGYNWSAENGHSCNASNTKNSHCC